MSHMTFLELLPKRSIFLKGTRTRHSSHTHTRFDYVCCVQVARTLSHSGNRRQPYFTDLRLQTSNVSNGTQTRYEYDHSTNEALATQLPHAPQVLLPAVVWPFADYAPRRFVVMRLRPERQGLSTSISRVRYVG